MTSENKFNDLCIEKKYKEAFKVGLQILNRKGSKRLITKWINKLENICYELDLPLPNGFYRLSVYKQRELLNQIGVKE